MKKLLIIIGFLFIVAGTFAQKPSIWKPVPKNLFTQEITVDRTIQGAWLWRLSAQITATELQYDVATKAFISMPLSSVGPAIGYRHYIALEDGTPFANFSANLGLLLGTDFNNVDPAKIKLALTVSTFNLNTGVCYTFNGANHFGILLGGTVNF